jgi:hypothetical protein
VSGQHCRARAYRVVHKCTTMFVVTLVALLSRPCTALEHRTGNTLPEQLTWASRSLSAVPTCFWAGDDCRADMDTLFPDHQLYLEVIDHRANATVCLSWMQPTVGSCRGGMHLRKTSPKCSKLLRGRYGMMAISPPSGRTVTSGGMQAWHNWYRSTILVQDCGSAIGHQDVPTSCI